jgi:integrase
MLCLEILYFPVTAIFFFRRESYERTVENYLIPYFGDRDLCSVTPLEMRSFFALQADKYSLSTIKKMMICLKGIYESAIDNDYCTKNPVKNIKINSNVEFRVKRTYTAKEVEKILTYSDIHKYGIYIRILLELGLRCSELCGLRRSDIDFERKTISISRGCTEVEGKAYVGKPKNKSSKRILPLSTELCDRLRIHLSKSKNEYLVMPLRRKNGLPITPCKFSNGRYKRFFIDMGIEKCLTPHECRHTCGTLLYEKTQDIYAVSKYLGHSSINTTAKLYVHENPEMLRTALKVS